MMSNSDARKRAAEKAAADERAGDVEALTEQDRHDIRNASCRAHRPGTETFICRPCADAEAAVLEQIVARLIAEAERRGAERALREAAEAWATGAWNDAFLAGDVEDDISAVRAMETWLIDRAAQIGEVRP